MKTKKIPDAITINFAAVSRPYLCYVSESKGFGFCQITSFLVTAATTATATATAEEFLAGPRPLSHRTQESNIPFGHLPSLRLIKLMNFHVFLSCLTFFDFYVFFIGYLGPRRHLEGFLEPVASFSQSMSPWRATATHFRPDFIN